LRRNLAQREGGTRGAVTGPVTDELMTVRRTAPRDRRHRGTRRCGRSIASYGRSSACRARLGRVGERLRIWEAVSVTGTFKGSDIPRQQGYVLQMIGDPVQMGGKRR